MNNHFFLAIVFGSIVLLSSCTGGTEQKPFCLGDIYKHILLSNVNNFTPLMDTLSSSADPARKAGYVQGNAGTFSYYYTSMYVNNLCNRDNPMINFEIILNNPNTEAIKVAYIQEEGSATIYEIPLEQQSNPEFYEETLGHVYEMVSGHTAGALYLQLKFRFPHQGSPSADSLYFFSNLNQFNMSVSSLAQGIP
ncbi:MAG: hypothetical protein AB7G44_09770 [Bacteroidia bacterium]